MVIETINQIDTHTYCIVSNRWFLLMLPSADHNTALVCIQLSIKIYQRRPEVNEIAQTQKNSS